MPTTATRISRAERKAQTRDALVDAAFRVFARQGFHGASLDEVAAEAGFTKGAVYSNFASKEDLFFAVYERRVDRTVVEMERRLAELGVDAGPLEVARATVERRRGGDDGWLAVFFEFWAHVLRHPELRERFLELHTRARGPLEAATARMDIGGADPARWTLTGFALVTGLGLEQLTDPSLDGAAATVQAFELMLAGARAGKEDRDGAP